MTVLSGRRSFIMAAAAMTVLRLGAFAPQATRLRRSAGSTATRPPARRACAVKAAGGDQVPGLWYVDEESQGEHPTSALRFLLSFTQTFPRMLTSGAFPSLLSTSLSS